MQGGVARMCIWRMRAALCGLIASLFRDNGPDYRLAELRSEYKNGNLPALRRELASPHIYCFRHITIFPRGILYCKYKYTSGNALVSLLSNAGSASGFVEIHSGTKKEYFFSELTTS